jgi:hypothetical protein
VGALYRNDIGVGVKSRTSASHDGSEAGDGEATDDTDYGNILGRLTAHTLRKNSSAIRIHLRLPLAGKLVLAIPKV